MDPTSSQLPDRPAEPLIHQTYPELFHYTDFAGLKGILESGNLWATRYDCLNDSTEVIHFKTSLQKQVANRILPAARRMMANLNLPPTLDRAWLENSASFELAPNVGPGLAGKFRFI